MARIVDLNVTKYAWLATPLPAPTAPTATLLTAGVDISTYTVATTAVMQVASETVNERSITDVSNVVVPTIRNYEGTLVLFRDFTAGVPAAGDPLATFVSGAVGDLVRRVGLPSSTAFTAAQKVDVFRFMVDSVAVQGGTGEGFLKATITLLQQGTFHTNVAVV